MRGTARRGNTMRTFLGPAYEPRMSHALIRVSIFRLSLDRYGRLALRSGGKHRRARLVLAVLIRLARLVLALCVALGVGHRLFGFGRLGRGAGQIRIA